MIWNSLSSSKANTISKKKNIIQDRGYEIEHILIKDQEEKVLSQPVCLSWKSRCAFNPF